MANPGIHAQSRPNHPAVVLSSTGEMVDYGTLNARSNQIAQYLAAEGFVPGDHVAIFMENNVRYFEFMWAAFRSGLIITPVNRYFTADEAAYVINDCGAKALLTSVYMRPVAEQLPPLITQCKLRLVIDGECVGYEDLDKTIQRFPATPLAEELLGQTMYYSSGTTGRPKGIIRDQPPTPFSQGLPNMERQRSYGIGEDTVYLSPAPVYHAAPLAYCMGVLGLGGTVVMMPRFDAEDALRCIQDFKITHSQWVPTMFIRMLKLPEPVRNQYDLSSHCFAVHAAAPCPAEVKQQMIEWWGPIIYEYYAGSEANGSTWIDSETWLKHPGSVGQARLGTLHICDEAGHDVPAGESGVIYFERPETPFTYHNDPDKTKDSQHPAHPNWTTLGDVGYVDEEGFLFLTDRKSFMIISGGVNIYPQAIEDALILHPQVVDAAVFGIPNEDFGEEVKAVVQLMPDVEQTPDMANLLIEHTRQKVAAYMVPRSIDFIDELPRLPTGKLYKRKLRDEYWQKK